MADLRATQVKNVLARYYEQLREHREALNRLNVYPVPDGDTGTNMTLTLAAVIDEVDGTSSMVELADAMAHGSLMGARGNSGVILSQVLRGLADVFRAGEVVGAEQLASALDEAAQAAYRAVLRPVEGTMLTVLREAAEAARRVRSGGVDDLAGLLTNVYDRAVEALRSTPDLLPVLSEAGVVDAGAAGVLLLVASFLEEATGASASLPEEVFRAVPRPAVSRDGRNRLESLEPRYEVMLFLDATEQGVSHLKVTWAAVGESIVIVGGDGTYNCHIHTDDIGEAVEAAIEAGRPSRIRVADLREEAAESDYHRPGFSPLPEVATARVGVVAVAVGEGVIEMFRSLGVQGVVVGGQTMNPSTAELLEVVEAVEAPTVLILPNNQNIVPVAERVDRHTTKRVLVVPTRTIPQGLAAMVAYLPGSGDPQLLAADMAAAAREVFTGELTRAVRDANTPIGPIKEGEWIGIVDGKVEVARPGLTDGLVALLERLAGHEPEIVTLITGEGADRSVVDAAAEWMAAHLPAAELAVVDGGQPVFPFLVSAE